MIADEDPGVAEGLGLGKEGGGSLSAGGPRKEVG